MANRVLFIFNPRAGKGQIRGKVFDIINQFTESGFDMTVHPTQFVDDARQTICRIGRDFNMIICSGGDGTLGEVVTGMMQSALNIPLGYIPSGSTNDFASSLDIPKNILTASNNILLGKPYGCDVGMFNDDYFVYIAAFGIFTDVSYSTNQDMKNLLGHLAYILEGVKKLYSIPTHHIRVYTSDSCWEGDYIYGMVTNSRSVGGFKKMTGKDVIMDDGLFEMMLIHTPKSFLELQEIITSLLTAKDDTELIDTMKIDSVVFECDGGLAWTLDGEFGGTHDIMRLSNCKQAVSIILPISQIGSKRQPPLLEMNKTEEIDER